MVEASPSPLPSHIAIVMDGNGRWAEQRKRPRSMGHQAGLKALRRVTEHCGKRGISELTVFAFSSENWNRPRSEVSRLMDLFMRALDKEAGQLHKNKVCLRFIGDLSRFPPELQNKVARVLERNPGDWKMMLNVAANYGGRWDIVEAARKLASRALAGEIQASDIDESLLSTNLASGLSDPDLLIRTGGELRLSNFLLWQSAYTELYFTTVLWPDFGPEEIDEAIEEFQSRNRRFGTIESRALKAAN